MYLEIFTGGEAVIVNIVVYMNTSCLQDKNYADREDLVFTNLNFPSFLIQTT
ncbi:hypothetical protein XBI1_2750001 [Xenorhabdus bovienii str. Intermedium]|uniref:Uncharacterized protein n=1 Tax=Xenorhabdus bovienii str. Intermedium TaxID=1379677 RepID=A0A077QJH3_XENBV|nr:hypothetical protein XBI1_2750001 [Xenorhabdus bovienii str. Intermedium]